MAPKTMPVFPNWFPYNDMMLDGHMKVGKWAGVKTRSWEWNYRGLVLLYNSGRTAQPAIRAYRYVDGPRQHKAIIGVGELSMVRMLVKEEAEKMVCNFNNISPAKVRSIIEEFETEDYTPENILFDFYNFGPYIAPFRVGFFFKSLQRFDRVPFSWPAGPVKPIFTRIVTGSELQKQLKAAGF